MTLINGVSEGVKECIEDLVIAGAGVVMTYEERYFLEHLLSSWGINFEIEVDHVDSSNIDYWFSLHEDDDRNKLKNHALK